MAIKLIMENWRGYIKNIDSGEIFERHEYITDVLGIQLPLDESGQTQLSEELKGQILQEHLLYENFLGSLISGAKETAGQIKELLLALAKILKDPGLLKDFIHSLAKNVIRPVATQFRKAFNKLKELGGKVGQFIEKISEMFENLLQKFTSMDDSWKKAMAGCTISLLLHFAYNKVKPMLKDVISGKVQEEFIEFLKEKFAEMFGEDLLNKVMGHITNIESWLGWIGPVVGGIKFVAKTLHPVTSRMNAELIKVNERMQST